MKEKIRKEIKRKFFHKGNALIAEKGNVKNIQEAGEKTICNDSVFSFAHRCDVINNP